MKNLENKIELAKPSLEHRDSFFEAVREFEAEGKSIYMHGEKPNDDFNKVLEKIRNYD